MVEKTVTIPFQLLSAISGWNPLGGGKNQGGDPLTDTGTHEETKQYTPAQIEEIKAHNERIEVEMDKRRRESAIQISNEVYRKHLEKKKAEQEKYPDGEEEKETLNIGRHKRRIVPEQELTLNEQDTLPTDQIDITNPASEVQEPFNYDFQQPSENPPLEPVQELLEQPPNLYEVEPDERARLVEEMSDDELIQQVVRVVPPAEQQSFRQYLTELGVDYMRFQLQLLGQRAEGISGNRILGFLALNQTVEFLYRLYLKSREKGAIVDKPYSPTDKPIEEKLIEFKQITASLPPQCRSEIFINPRTKMPEMVVTCQFEDERRPRIYRQY